MEKIHAPADDVTVFGIFGGREGDRKRYLFFQQGRQRPFLFTSSHHIPTNAQPPAQIMRLRKHLFGKRVEHAICQWIERRLWLGFAGGAWLQIDMREGASLSYEAPEPSADPCWPDADILKRPQDEWRQWDVLTPALRRVLSGMDQADAAALLEDLRMGGGDIFVYERNGECVVSAWPLPDKEKDAEGWTVTVFSDPISAMEKAGDHIVLKNILERARENAARPFYAESARLGRLLKKLDAEEQRLGAMKGKQEDALLLKSQMYRLDKHARMASVALQKNGKEIVLALDPRRTLAENMAEMFHQAGRGKRGLEHLAKRRIAVALQKERAEQAALATSAAVSGSTPQRTLATPATAEKTRGVLAGLPSQVQAFRSSDGFLILRGRSTKGNGLALKLAAPHDYWLHTAEGPSAHVIIRRDHAAQDVPERTMLEAGILAALKSWQKDQGNALIQYAIAKYIHPMKNAPAGMVRIDRSEGSFAVSIDQDLEHRLDKS